MDIETLLDQAEFWVSKRGLIKVADMDAIHKVRAAQWLYMRAPLLLTLVECLLHTDIRDDKGDEFDELQPLLQMLNVNPRDWITGTVLYQALTCDTEGVDIPVRMAV